MKKLTSKKGFTLIEMLVVIAIIAVLVAIIVPTVTNSTTKAKAATDAANLRSVAAEAAIYVLNNDDELSETDAGKISCPESSTTAGTYPDIWKNNNTGEIIAVYGSSTVGDFSDVADGTTTPLAASFSSSDYTKLAEGSVSGFGIVD